MNWKDIVKAPYDTQAYDKEIDVSVEERLNKVLRDTHQSFMDESFDDRAQEAQRTQHGEFKVRMTKGEYMKALNICRNDIGLLQTTFKNLYNANKVEFWDAENGEKVVVFYR